MTLQLSLGQSRGSYFMFVIIIAFRVVSLSADVYGEEQTSQMDEPAYILGHGFVFSL